MKRNAERIVRRLREHGHEAYLVGGCVRDMLLGKRPKDWDVATSARPDEVETLFKKTLTLGARFGVVIVRMSGRSYEVATFREEAEYTDGRRPDKVEFSTARADAMRRDFTVNGMFHDPVDDRVIDYVGGLADLAEGLIRAIGNPGERFDEDKLRMVRAVRFAASLGYEIEPETSRAVREHAAEIKAVSAERIRDELSAILAGPAPERGVRLLDFHGLLEEILPEVAAMKGVAQPEKFHPEGDVFEHTLLMLKKTKRRWAKKPEFAMAVLLHDVGKPPTFEVKDRIRFNNHAAVGADMAADIMRRLRFSREQEKTVEAIVRDHLKFIEVRNMRHSTLKRFLRQRDFDLHLELHRLDCLASHGDMDSYEFCKEKLEELGEDQETLRPPRLLTGDDLIAVGLAPGPLFKEILSALEDAQLEGKVNTRSEALDWVKVLLAGRS